MFLDGAQKQNNEWPKEPAEHEKGAEVPPTSGISGHKVLDLLWNIRVPDQHVLGETDVGPENDEREHPFPHDVVMLKRHHVRQISCFAQSCNDQNKQRHRTAGGASKDVDAPHG